MSVEAVKCDDSRSPVIHVRGIADMAVEADKGYVMVAKGKTQNDLEAGHNREGQLLLALIACFMTEREKLGSGLCCLWTSLLANNITIAR